MELPRAGPLSERAANMVENLAFRIAERHGGTLTPNHLVPYVPMSLALIRECLDGLVDNETVCPVRTGHVEEYEFTTYADAPKEPAMLKVRACVSCDADLASRAAGVFCPSCSRELGREIARLAEKTAWPAQAVYEHEILYLAAHAKGPVHAEDLAGRSCYTLRNMRRKLDAMSKEGSLCKVFDEHGGAVVYEFPAIEYPKGHYKTNMDVIRGFPASVMEEVQTRVTLVLFALGALVLGLFVMAFMRVPFPVLILMFLVAAPVISILIWSHRTRPEDD